MLGILSLYAQWLWKFSLFDVQFPIMLNQEIRIIHYNPAFTGSVLVKREA